MHCSWSCSHSLVLDAAQRYYNVQVVLVRESACRVTSSTPEVELSVVIKLCSRVKAARSCMIDFEVETGSTGTFAKSWYTLHFCSIYFYCAPGRSRLYKYICVFKNPSVQSKLATLLPSYVQHFHRPKLPQIPNQVQVKNLKFRTLIAQVIYFYLLQHLLQIR